MQTAALIPTGYFPPIIQYQIITQFEMTIVEQYEHFQKQTYRNRCVIYGANGPLSLVIPLEKRHERTITKDIKISYNENWQKLHWRSIESSYRRSPYFEFYEDDFSPFYFNKKNIFLLDWNNELFETVNRLLKLKATVSLSTEYVKNKDQAADFRDLLAPRTTFEESKKKELKLYSQTFESKKGFIPNLSIIDLLFNLGPKSMEYLIN